MDVAFEWDPRKARSNEEKHGISFAEAETVFSDEQALLLDDPGHAALLAAATGFEVVARGEAALRRERGAPVAGVLMVLRRGG